MELKTCHENKSWQVLLLEYIKYIWTINNLVLCCRLSLLQCTHFNHLQTLNIPFISSFSRLSFMNRVGSFQLDWALGAFIMHRISNLSEEHSDWISLFRKNSLVVLSVLAFSALLIFAAWSVLRWRRTQLKTVYDLEKGRYIVTRVNRWLPFGEEHLPM